MSQQDKSEKKLSSSKRYKALILDVDGTTIINGRDNLPSRKVTKAIARASKILHVGLATSRPLYFAMHIMDHLQLSGPSIVNGGAQIVDAVSKKVIWHQQIANGDVIKTYDILKKIVKNPIIISDGAKDHEFVEKSIPDEIFQIYIDSLPPKTAEIAIDALSHIPTLALNKVPSWENGCVDLLITHARATKQYGIFEVAKMMEIETHEIIGVGDGYNDFPLLMACGLKIAMGNAVPELKEIADYIAPTVEEDGVAHVIEKFVL